METLSNAATAAGKKVEELGASAKETMYGGQQEAGKQQAKHGSTLGDQAQGAKDYVVGGTKSEGEGLKKNVKGQQSDNANPIKNSLTGNTKDL